MVILACESPLYNRAVTELELMTDGSCRVIVAGGIRMSGNGYIARFVHTYPIAFDGSNRFV